MENRGTAPEHLAFPAYEDVLHHIMAHPLGLPAIHGYDDSPDWDYLLDCGQEPSDPNAKYRWKVTRDAYDSIKPFLKEREGHLKRYKLQRGYHTSLNVLKERDPLYERTMHVMEKLMGDLPQVVKELAMPTLAREFGPFLRLYEELRLVAHTVENHYHNKRLKSGRSHDAERRESSVSTGGRKPRDAGSRAELDALVKRMKSGVARDGDLLRYFELMDVG